MTNGEIPGASSETVPHPQAVVVPDLPQVLKDMMADLDNWAGRCYEDAKHDSRNFWSLKLPAIIISASSGLLAHFRFEVGLVAGIVASMCVLLDGLLRAGALRAIHTRAVFDLKTLKHDIEDRWRAGSLRGNNLNQLNQLAATIVEYNNKERNRIATYLRDEETAFSHGSDGRPS
jgi:hypothetical protein